MTLPDRFVADAGLDVVEVTGADRTSFLDDVLTQKLDDARPGQVLGALELEQHGSVLLVMDVAVLDDRLLLLLPAAPPRPDTPPPMTPPGRERPPMPDLAAAAVARLTARTFLKDASFARRDDLAVLLEVDPGAGPPDDDLTGPRGAAVLVLDEQGQADPAQRRRWVGELARPGDLAIVRDGHRLLVTTAAEQRLAAARDAGLAVVDAEARDAWRLAAGEPGWGHELVAPHLPEELGLLPTHVHLAKGCYPGQEAVARMWVLGRPRRRLARVAVEGVVDGEAVDLGAGRRRVLVTRHRDGRGLAFVPGDATAGDRFGGDGEPSVVVVEVLGDDPSPPGHDPRQVRRRDRRAASTT